MKSLVFEATASMRFTVLIPARLASTRLPNKPLADLGGAPMVVRVAQRVLSGMAPGTAAPQATPAGAQARWAFTLVSVEPPPPESLQ